MASISFRVANTTSLAHNNRENIHGNPDIKVDRMKDNITYIKKEIEEVYQDEFHEVVEEYNAKQKRSDRKIKDYYSKILNSKSTHHQRELIVAIGKADDGVNEELKKNVLDQYMSDFQKRNPNLVVYNAVMHLDEANPHLHINYIPIYRATRGLKKRVGHDKAIEQQGKEIYKNFIEWQEHERAVLERLMSHYELEREKVGTHQYMSVKEYKNLKEELKELQDRVKDLDQKKDDLEKQVKVYEKKTKSSQFEKSELDIKIDNRLFELQSMGEKVMVEKVEKTPQKNLLGRDHDRFTVEGNEIRKIEKKLKLFEVVCHHNKALQSLNHKLENDNKTLKGELYEVKRDRNFWRSEAREKEKENDELIYENKTLKRDLKEIFKVLEDKFKENELVVRLMTIIPFFRKMKEREESEKYGDKRLIKQMKSEFELEL